MTSTDDVGADEGGESPCLAHLLDEPQHVTPELFAQLVDDVAAADAVLPGSQAAAMRTQQ
jgi:hypothetical protein